MITGENNMEFAAVHHKTSEQMSYPLDEDHLVINLKTGYDVKRVFIIHGDPFDAGRRVKSETPGFAADILLCEGGESFTLPRQKERIFIMGNCTSGKELKVCIDKLHTCFLE